MLSTEKGKNAIGLISKATALKMHHTFLNIALLSRNYYDMKTPNFMLFGGRKQATTN